MKPVRIKYYGIIWLTKRAYLLTTLFVFIGAGIFLLIVALTIGDRFPPFRWPWDPMAPGFHSWFHKHFWTITLLALVAEAIDIIVTLQKIAAKEAEEAGDDDSA